MTIESVRQALDRLPRAAGWVLGFSGGLDSTVLLHILLARHDRPALTALHVNHGLQSGSGRWLKHCARVCAQHDVRFKPVKIRSLTASKGNTEALAREARYAAFREFLGRGAILFTAHHADDQSETLLLNLIRGSGPAGLAAMPELTPFHHGRHARPMLRTKREDILAYARKHGLDWIEDPSNQDSGYDRNFLRHVILPPLRQRRPGLDGALSRVAEHQATCARLLSQLAAQDLNALCSSPEKSHSGPDEPLSQAGVCRLDRERQANLIRYWLTEQGFQVPPSSRMRTLLDQVRPEPDDRVTEVQWQGCVVNGWRGGLYAGKPLPKPDTDFLQGIRPDRSTPLSNGNGILTWVPDAQGLDRNRMKDAELSVRSRKGGERLRIHARGPSRELKKLYQDAHIPPWERDRRPLLFADECLIAVPGLFMAVDWLSRDGSGLRPEWKSPCASQDLRHNPRSRSFLEEDAS